MNLEELISVSAIFIIAAAFVCILVLGTYAVIKLMQTTLGKIRSSEKEAYTALLTKHENSYHTKQREAILKGEPGQTITVKKKQLEL